MFSAKQFLQDIRVSGRFNHKLTLKWPDFTITNKFAPLKYDLPVDTQLNRAQYLAAKQMLAQAHHILLFTKNMQGKYTLCPLQGSIWAMQTGASQPALKTSPPLYPTL